MQFFPVAYTPPALFAFSHIFALFLRFSLFSAIFSKIISDFALFRFALVWRGLSAWARARRELSGIAEMLAKSSNRRQMITIRRGVIKLGDGAGAGAEREQATEAETERETEMEKELEIEDGSGNGIRNWKQEYIAFRTKKRKRSLLSDRSMHEETNFHTGLKKRSEFTHGTCTKKRKSPPLCAKKRKCSEVHQIAQNI